jgi:hypothetical protein
MAAPVHMLTVFVMMKTYSIAREKWLIAFVMMSYVAVEMILSCCEISFFATFIDARVSKLQGA